MIYRLLRTFRHVRHCLSEDAYLPLLPPNDLGEALTPDCNLVPPKDHILDPLEDRVKDTLTEDRTLEPLDDRTLGPDVPTLDLLVTGLMVDVLLDDFILEPVF